MPNYGIGAIGTPAAAAGAAYATFNTNASRRARIYKLFVTNASAVFSQLGLIRATNTPVATTTFTPQQYDIADAAATALLSTAWSTAPTVGTNFISSFSLGAAQGSGLTDVWQSDKEITLAVSVWLVLWNPGAGAGGAQSVTVAHDE